jgi:hypothetical protein
MIFCAGKIRIWLLISLTLWQLPTAASACPVCLGRELPEPTLAEKLGKAQDAVVALPARGVDAFEIQSVIKGASSLQGTRVRAPGVKSNHSAILTRTAPGEEWQGQGPSGIHLTGFFRTVLALPADPPVTTKQWLGRLEAMLPYLDHKDPRVCRSAWADWAGAPYGVLRTRRLDPKKLRRWMADPTRAYAQPLWIVLLGISGDEADASRRNHQLRAAWESNDATLLAALLTARMEHEGASAVTWLENQYILDRDRTLDEVLAAVTALSVHGADGSPLRARIQQACHTFIAERPPLSGLVADDLIRWQDWSMAKFYQALLDSGAPILPEARPRINRYLNACRESARPAIP